MQQYTENWNYNPKLNANEIVSKKCVCYKNVRWNFTQSSDITGPEHFRPFSLISLLAKVYWKIS